MSFAVSSCPWRNSVAFGSFGPSHFVGPSPCPRPGVDTSARGKLPHRLFYDFGDDEGAAADIDESVGGGERECMVERIAHRWGGLEI